MKTNIPHIASKYGTPWRRLRLLSSLAILLTAATLPAATVIDNFDAPAGGTELWLAGNMNYSVTDSGIGVWGGERRATLTRTSPPATVTIVKINKNDYPGLLRYEESSLQTTTLELHYGTETIVGSEHEVIVDIPFLDPIGQDYVIDLTVKAFNLDPADPFTATPDSAITQSLIVQQDGTYLGGNAFSLSFDLSSNHFQSLHSYFNGASHIAFSLLFYGANDSDVLLESILLQAINGGGGPDVVPEPSTYALGLTSMLGLFYYGYRRRRRAKC